MVVSTRHEGGESDAVLLLGNMHHRTQNIEEERRMAIKLNRNIFDETENNPLFKALIERALSHFLNLGSSEETYEVPSDVSDTIWPEIRISRDSGDDTIYVTENGTIDD